MKLYCHSILTNNRSKDNKLIKNACEKIVLNIFFKAQNEMKKEVEKIVNSKFSLEESEEITRALFAGRNGRIVPRIESMKEELRDRVVEKYSEVQSLNLTKLAKENRINITRIQGELENLGGKWFVFNFINRKKIPKELISRVVKDVEFIQSDRGVIFQYRIPVPILNFLVFPDQYASVDMEIIKKLKSKYSIKLYLLLVDHKKRGILELKKQEIVDCFSLPESYCKNRKTFLDKFLIPTIKELEEVAKMKLIYNFKQDYSFDEVVIKIQRNMTTFSPEILGKIEYITRNLYIQKAWDTRAEEFLLNYCDEKGEESGKKLLQSAYEKLNTPIKTSLANYFFVLSKKIEIDIQMEEIERSIQTGESSERDFHFQKEKKTAWEIYEDFSDLDKEVYRNLARLYFEEKLGSKTYPEQSFQVSFRSLVTEIIDFEW